MGIFDDTSASAEMLAEMELATVLLPQLPAPQDWSFTGLLPPRLFFNEKGRTVGALPRWLVDAPQHRNAFILRGHLLNAVSLAIETAMRRAEEQAGVLALARLVERLTGQARRWAEDEPRPGHRAAAEYVYTLAGLWQITTFADPSEAAYDSYALERYLQRVPSSVRQQVAWRLKDLYADTEIQPASSYIRSDLMRRYWWTICALTSIYDNIQLAPQYLTAKPYLVVDDEAAWDLLYRTIGFDQDLRTITVALSKFYHLLVGRADVPNAHDYLDANIGPGRAAAATFARQRGLPNTQLDQVGLGRSLLPKPVSLSGYVADVIRRQEIADSHVYSAIEFGTLMEARRLLLGTDYTAGIIGMRLGAAYLDRLIEACAASFVNPDYPDSRDLADCMALMVTGMSTTDPGDELPRQLSKSVPSVPPGLHLDPRITPALADALYKAMTAVWHVIDELSRVAGLHVRLDEMTTLLAAMPVLGEMAESSQPIRPWTPAFEQLAALDWACEPKAVSIFSLKQSNSFNMHLSWITVPALVEQSLVLSDPHQAQSPTVSVKGVVMLPYQGIVPRAIREEEIPELFWPLAMDADDLLRNIGYQTGARVRYHRCLVAYTQ